MSQVHKINIPKHYIRFDPANAEHRQKYAHFIVKGRWPDDIRFVLEDPFHTVPTMMERRLVEYFLKQQGDWPKTEAEIHKLDPV